jgi:hypothetical protein
MDSLMRPHDRYHYTEFDLDSATIGMIEDLENKHAWIHSSEVRKVRP